jgi:hypothetical protein
MTPSRKEYLYQLSDLSENSHTADYLTTVIEKVINDIGKDRICAVVSDNAAMFEMPEKSYTKIIQISKMCAVSHMLST